MLKSLYISNYALINELSIDFQKGMTVLTGETGAGKSIIIGALSLVMGQRADSRVVKEGEIKAVVEICFDIKAYKLQHLFDENGLDYSNHTIIRREVNSNGKSRAFINDTPVALTVLRDLSNRLIDIHSQHENLLLSTEDYQLQVVDAIADNQTDYSVYQNAFRDWSEAVSHLNLLRKEAEKQNSGLDYLQYQLSQLDEAKLVEGEQSELESEILTLNHIEEIKNGLHNAGSWLEEKEINILSSLREVVHDIQKIHAYLPNGEELLGRFETILIELKDLTSEIESYQRNIDFDPSRLDFVDNRLATLYALQKKFKVDSVEAMITLRDEIRDRINRIDNFDEELEKAEKELLLKSEKLKTSADRLTSTRLKVIPEIEKQLKSILQHLGMPDIQFVVQLNSTDDYVASGADKVTFLFSANKNRSVLPIAEIASGGEISRLMLAIKSMLVSKAELPTIIFDEIDAGVSGDIAGRMGEIMRAMSKQAQVIVITHLPQIASKGTEHFSVFKDNSGIHTETHMKRLTSDERIIEIAKLLSGSTLTDAALMNARELMTE